MSRALSEWLPGLRVVGGYRASWALADTLAGLVLAALVVTLGMAYAPLAGLQPIHGLYASLMSLLAYAVFGPSRILVLGPDSSTAPLVAAAIIPLAASDPAQRAALAAILAVLVGGIALFVGVARLGFVTDLIAKPVRIGYMNGVALFIVVSQLPKLFGFQTSASSVGGHATAFAVSIDQTNAVALIIGATSLAALLIGLRLLPGFPVVLIVVVAATVFSAWTDATAQGVATVGILPTGLPSLVLPQVSWEMVRALAVPALGIAVITLADSSVLSESLAGRYGYETKTDQEFVAIGAANVAAGVFQGFPVSGSVTRSAVNVSSGAKTQLAGVLAAVLVGVMLIWIPGLLSALPLSALAAIVITAGVSLTDVGGTMRLWRQRRTEFSLSLVTFGAVVILGVLGGVFVAIALSVLNFMRRQWYPHDAVLGRAPGVKGYHDITDFTDAQQIPGLLLYRFDAPLFFANARVFREHVQARLAEQPDVTRVVFVADPLIDVDTTAADMLTTVIKDLDASGIEVGFAGLRHVVRERLGRYGVLELVNPELLSPTIGEAVHRFVADSGVEWVDWEDAVQAEEPQADN